MQKLIVSDLTVLDVLRHHHHHVSIQLQQGKSDCFYFLLYSVYLNKINHKNFNYFSRAAANYERPAEKKRDDYVTSKRDEYKRDIEVPRHATNYQANARDNHKDSRYAEQDPRSNFRRADERDTRLEF